MTSETISSRENQKFKMWKSLLERKGLKKHGLFLLSGEKVVFETLRDNSSLVKSLLLPAETLISFGDTDEIKKFELAPELFNELDIFGTRTPLIVGETPPIPEWKETDPTQGLELLCPLGDPSNLGALIRSAMAFGVSKVVLLKESAHPFHPKSLRAASGGVLTCPLALGPSIHELQSTETIALDLNGTSLKDFEWPRDTRLLVGEEGPGLPSNSQFRRLTIGQKPNVESLNATTAATIAMHSYYIQNDT